ncbi:MAG: PAS domain S-box protein [Algoriphagus sp.]|nr:PAS domain S-box protein [Algoriphagus sp.]
MNQFKQFDISDFFDAIQDPLFLIDSDEIIFFNQYFKQDFELLNDHWRDFFSDEKIIKNLENFFESGELPKGDYINSIKDKSGKSHRYEWSFMNLPSGYNSRFLVVKGSRIKFFSVEFQDGDLVDKEAIISHELGYIQSILSNSHDLIAILDGTGKYKFISPSVSEKLGFQVEDIVGKNYQDFIGSGIIEIIKGDFREVLKTGKEVNIDFWIHKENGEKLYIESFAKNLHDHPQIQGILFSAREITEYVETDLSLQRRFEIENLINKISTKLINSRLQDLEYHFNESLKLFSEFLKSKKSKILILNKETQQFELLNEWKIIPDISGLSYEECQKHISNQRAFLEEGKVKLLTQIGHNEISGLLLIPMVSSSRILGLISFELDLANFQFAEKELQILKQFGDILAGVYVGSQMTRRIERNENLLTTTEILSRSGSWTFSTFRNRFFMSGGLANLFGLGSQPISTEFTTLIYRIEKPYRKEFVQNLKNVIKKPGKSSGEFIITNREGKLLNISYEIESKKDFLTQGIEVFGFCKDITQKRDAENYLRLQSQILAQVSDPIVVTNPDLEVIYLNEAAIQVCCPETARAFNGPIGNLIKLNSQDGLSFESITANLQLGQPAKEITFLETLHTKFSPFEISAQIIHADGKEGIGYSFILHSLAEKYENEQISKRAQLIVENSPAVLFIVDPELDYKITYISENINRFGYQSKEMIQNGASFLDLLHPEDASWILRNSIDSRTDSGIPAFSGEYRIKKADGTYLWVEDQTTEVYDEHGNVILHEGLFQDITDRKKLQFFNEEKDKQYRLLAANIPGSNIFLLDKQRKYILAEGTNFEFWGMKREDFEGKYIREISITNYEEIDLILDRVYENREIYESEFFFKDRFYQRIIRPIIENGEVEFALSIIRDINEEHQAKENLKKSEEKYRNLVEESTEIIFSLTDTFHLHYVSPNVKQFLGYEANEVLGLSIFDFLNPEDLDIFQSMLGSSKDFLAENQFLEFRLRHKDGEYRVFNSNGRMTEDKHEGKRFYTGIARDISKLKEAQRELFHAKERAEQASIVKSQFLSVMSHEIRTPMNAVIGLAHFLMEEDPRPDQLENLKTLQFSAENLMGLISDILDYSKIESGKVELEEVPLDLRNLLHRTVHSHSFQALEKSLKISCEIDESIPELLIGDPVRLGQIVNNLVSNAIKFTEKGAVRIVLQQSILENGKSAIKFSFEDSGIGIPQEKLGTIFEAFTQASSSTTRKYGGTGLGLAIVKRLVELHGGEIIVHSGHPTGSVFEFTLEFKIVEESIKSKSFGKIVQPKSLQEASILVAEDNIVNQILIQKFLTKWNAGKLVIASDGQQALDLYNSGYFNIVLLDLQMPRLDGFSVAKAIRNHPDPEKRDVPILALTASSLHEVKQEMEEAGIDDFIPKPFTPEALYEKLVNYLNPKVQE